jgi:hypothetical protein
VYRRGKTRASKRRAPSGLASATRENGHVIAQALMLVMSKSCSSPVASGSFFPRQTGDMNPHMNTITPPKIHRSSTLQILSYRPGQARVPTRRDASCTCTAPTVSTGQ